jgi:hypothetical protein
VFTRILGSDEIEQGAFWSDSTQCWICNKWNNLEVQYDPMKDKQVFIKKVDEIEQLKENIEQAVTRALDEMGIYDEPIDFLEEEELLQTIAEEQIEGKTL